VRILVLSYFDIYSGPRIFLKAPETLKEKFLEKIPQLMTIYETGFFVHIFDDFKSANLIFEIPSEYSRGNQEILLLSIIIKEEKYDLNVVLSRELMEEFAKEIKEIDKAYKAFYYESDVFEFDVKIYEKIRTIFLNFYKNYKPTIEALMIAELRYQALFEGARDAILIIDRNTEIIIDVNKQLETLLKRPREELIGLHMSEFQPSGGYKNFKRDISVQLNIENPSPFVAWILRSDGKKIPIEINASEIQMGKLRLIQFILRNIERRVKAEKQLKESEKKYRHLFENSPNMLLLLDSEGKIIDANSLYLNYFKYSKEEIIGLNFRKLKKVSQETMILLVEGFKKVLENGFLEPMEIQLNTNMQNQYWIILRASLIEIGGKSLVYAIMNDISERKRAEQLLIESEKKYRGILENMREGYYEVDLKGDFTFFNRRVCDFLGYSKYELLGMNFSKLVKKEDYQSIYDKFKAVYKNDTPHLIYELEIIKSDKTKKIVENSIYLRKDLKGNKLGFYGLARDITKKKMAEKQLKKSEEKYREAYNRVNFYKDLFAHDISNIIQNIHSSTELITLGKYENDLIEKNYDLIEIIKEQVNRAKSLINNVRYLSELEESEMSLEKIEVFQILNDSIRYINESYQDRSVSIQIEFYQFEVKDKLTLYVQANQLLNDVFDNILTNAIKYNDNSIVEIQIIISKERIENQNFLKLEFIDNGIGIPDNRKKAIFQRGYHKERSVKGMGLGLSLVKHIINSYNGKIWVENKICGDYSKGSNFIVLIPEIE